MAHEDLVRRLAGKADVIMVGPLRDPVLAAKIVEDVRSGALPAPELRSFIVVPVAGVLKKT